MVIARDCSEQSVKQMDIEIAVQHIDFLEKLDALYANERT
jgi:hypothetical protein